MYVVCMHLTVLLIVDDYDIKRHGLNIADISKNFRKTVYNAY